MFKRTVLMIVAGMIATHAYTTHIPNTSGSFKKVHTYDDSDEL